MLLILGMAGAAGLDGISLGVLSVGSGWAIVGLFFILFFRGQIVPRKTLEDMQRAHQQILEDISHDRDEWRAAHRISETARLEEREHNTALLKDIAEPFRGFLLGFRKATNEVSEQ